MTEQLAEAGLTDDQVTAALAKIYSNEKLSPKLNAMVKTATEDFNAEKGRVQQLRTEATKREAELAKYYADVNRQHAAVVKELDDLRRGGGDPNQQVDMSKYLTKEDMQATLQQQGSQFGVVLKDVTAISSKHAVRFHEELDLEEIEKIATEQRLSIRQAYAEYIKPREAKELEVQQAKWKEDTRKEIERDIRSTHRLPIDPRPSEYSLVHNRPDAKDIPANMDQELMATWRNAEPSA